MALVALSLSALAAQGELVAGGVARDATKATYARVMAKTLGGEAEHEAEKLADATASPEVEHERDAAVEVAAEIADLFSELQIFPGDERHGALVCISWQAVTELAVDRIVVAVSESR